MTCTECGEKPKKCNCHSRDFPSAVVEINNPEQLVLLRKVLMPSSLPEADNPPVIGKYRNVILKYEDTGNVYIYSSDGIPTAIEANVPQEILDKIADLEEDIETEETRRISADDALRSSINTVSGNLSAEISARQNADTAIRGDLTALTNRVTTAEGDIDTIEGKIPNQATSQNQLADKNFVNSSIATNTANFIGTFNSVAELEAYSGTVTNNDYAFVIVTDAQGNTAYDRYKYNGDTEQWIFEYELNNSSFTAEQWAAINSGITSGNVTKLSGLANIKTIGSNLSLSQIGELSATDTTYTAGNGLSLNGTQFSVDTTTIATQSDLTTGLATKQNTLTAGNNIQINNDTISATDTTYTAGTNVQISSGNVISATDTTYSAFTGTDGTSAGASGLVPAPTTADAGKVLGANGSWVTGGPTVVQTTGTSTTDVMSQNAATSMLYYDPGTQYQVRIGYDAINAGNNAIVIGKNAGAYSNYSISIGTGENVYGIRHSSTTQSPYAIAIGSDTNTHMDSDGSIAMGYGAQTSGGSANNKKRGQIALGAYSSTSEKGEMNIGSSDTSYGYNYSNYRLLTGLYDPQNAHDAATKGYVDSVAPTITMTTTDPGEGAALAANSFIGVYQ